MALGKVLYLFCASVSSAIRLGKSNSTHLPGRCRVSMRCFTVKVGQPRCGASALSAQPPAPHCHWADTARVSSVRVSWSPGRGQIGLEQETWSKPWLWEGRGCAASEHSAPQPGLPPPEMGTAFLFPGYLSLPGESRGAKDLGFETTIVGSNLRCHL